MGAPASFFPEDQEPRTDKERFLRKAWNAIRSVPDDLREKGLTVAVHNDYMIAGQFRTFWLMTLKMPATGHHAEVRAFKGEGTTDQEALDQIRGLYAEMTDTLHHAPLCPANHFHGSRAPIAPCNCGAAAAEKAGV